jgi:predicted TIM-barrel fold metal-dependent hydrolase
VWDVHAHVIGDQREYPFAPGRGYTPNPAPLDDYLAMLDRHHIARGVLVQPSVYGHDHRCLFDALERAGGRLSGIAVPSPDATTKDLAAMHERGIRGVRCNLINPGGLSPAVVYGWLPALRVLDWHVEFHIAVDRMPGWTNVIDSFDVPVVIDHMGRPDAVDPWSPALAQLIGCVREDRCFVKLSAPYRLSQSTERPRAIEKKWADVSALARAFLEASASNCCWGTDWPHVDTGQPIDTGELVAALDDWRGDRWTRQQITGEAAARLYG